MYPHRIRLRGPWECEPVARLVQGERSTADLPTPLRMTMPCRFRETGLAGFAGRVRLRRRFGYPGRIDTFERVWLTIAGLSEKAEIILNGEKLANIGEKDWPWEYEITSLLQPRNELVILLETATDAGGLWGEVALEIRRTAFLRNVQARLLQDDQPRRLQVTGEVVGHSDRPLELYALANGTTIAYETIQPASEGNFFELTSHDEDEIRQLLNRIPLEVRVDLVDGAVIWYAVETRAA